MGRADSRKGRRPESAAVPSSAQLVDFLLKAGDLKVSGGSGPVHSARRETYLLSLCAHVCVYLFIT